MDAQINFLKSETDEPGGEKKNTPGHINNIPPYQQTDHGDSRPYVLRAGLRPRREGKGQVKGPVWGDHPLLLQNGVEPVDGDTPPPLS